MDGLRVTTAQSMIDDNLGLRDTRTNGLQKGLSPAATETGASFGDTLREAIGSVDNLQKDADKKMQDLSTGKSQNLHETMIATEKADLALRLMVQVRNKIIDAYQEIMKMQV